MNPLILGLALVAAALPAWAGGDDTDLRVQRGRYVIEIAGCNDCHTPGFSARSGNVPEAQWLTGDRLGWHGPWGTTYAPNLRLYMQELTETQWLSRARTLSTRPPMPWFNVRAMNDDDLRAIYHYVRHLGPTGQPAPAYIAPGRIPPAPYMELRQ